MTDFDQIAPLFWDRSSDYLVLPPLTDDMLRAAETELGVRLPSAFVRLVRQQNGGVVAPDYQACPSSLTSWADDHAPFTMCFGIGEGWGSINESRGLNQEWGQPEDLVLLNGDGHWWVALDYRTCGRRGEPSVVWYDNELDEDAELAPDFRSFVEALRPIADFEE